MNPEHLEYQVYIVPIAAWVLALVCAGIAIARGPRPVTAEIVADKLLRYLFVFPVGLMGLWSFCGPRVLSGRGC